MSMTVEVNTSLVQAGDGPGLQGYHFVGGFGQLAVGTATVDVSGITIAGGGLRGPAWVSRSAAGGAIGDLTIAMAIQPSGAVRFTVTSANAGDTSFFNWGFIGFGTSV